MNPLDAIPCGIVSFDEDGRIIYVNQTLLQMAGREREDVIGQPLDVLFPRGGKIFLQTHFIPLLRMYGHFEEVYFELRRDGVAPLPVLINAKQRRDGEALITDCALMAVSQRGQYESAILDARRAAEEANKSKARFLSMVSHDLRTPLQAISGYAEALHRGFHGSLNDEQQADVDAIRAASRELKHLVDDILGYATIESGSVDLSLEDVHVGAALTRARTMIAIRMEESGLEFTAEPPEEDRTVRADPDRLQQILLNLLTNATKFTPRGGRITLSFRVIEMTGVFEVRDTGRGIAADKLESIFEPFTQLERPEEQHDQGVGLGLAISRELARAMGGELSAESEPGQGSTFRVELPLGLTAE